MVKKEFLNRIYNDFKSIIENRKILGILILGSYSEGENTDRSDIDICIVAPDENIQELLAFIWKEINTNLKKYDVRVFNEIPLFIKIQVIEKGILLYTPDKYDLYEYFYFYRKLWSDQKHRQEISKFELFSFSEI